MRQTGETIMADEIKVTTNNVPRDLVDAWDLSASERAEFDYLDWDAIEDGRDSATFLRFKGHTYDLGEFQTTSGLPEFSPLRKWDGYLSDSFFSGVVVRYCDQYCETVVVGTFYG